MVKRKCRNGDNVNVTNIIVNNVNSKVLCEDETGFHRHGHTLHTNSPVVNTSSGYYNVWRLQGQVDIYQLLIIEITCYQ